VAPFAMHHLSNIESPWSKYFVDEIEFGASYSMGEKLVRVPKVIYSVEARRKLERLLEVFPADICHAHNIYHHISPSILELLHRHGIPLVMTLHDLKLACPAYNMLASDGICERCRGGRIHNVLLHRCIKGSTALSAIVMMEALLHRTLRTFQRYVSRFVVPSRFYIDKLVDWGWERSRFAHIPNAIDLTAFSPDYLPGRSFVYFGRLSREKGLATLIKAASRAGVPLQIIGAGPEEGNLRQLTQRIGADVTFLGYLKGRDLHDVIRSSRAVVLPSEWYENAPMSVMEAYGLGKTVIGADIGGIPELIRSGETGFIFPSGSETALAVVLSNVSRLSEESLSEMAYNGRQWMATEYCHEKYRDRILALYRELGVSC